MTGTINKVKLDKGFGFIKPTGLTTDIFFHVSSLEGLAFDEQLLERRVTFDTIDTAKGLRAVDVRTAD